MQWFDWGYVLAGFTGAVVNDFLNSKRLKMKIQRFKQRRWNK